MFAIQAKRALHHEQLRRVLLEISSMQQAGGLTTRNNGIEERFWPALALIITDEPEAELCTLLRGCRICNASVEQWNDPYADCTGIYFAHAIRKYMQTTDACESV